MQIIPSIIIICWAVFILYWIVSSFGVKRDIGRTPWRRLWWVRVAIASVVVGWIWGTSSLGRLTHHIWVMNAPISGTLGIIGAVLCVLGVGLAIWARVHLGRNWSPAPALKQEHELVRSGPYALVRHPIYTGIILAALGSTLTSPVWLIMFFIVSSMFIWRVYVEENLMIQQFPNQYPEYKERTWALIPFVW